MRSKAFLQPVYSGYEKRTLNVCIYCRILCVETVDMTKFPHACYLFVIFDSF